MSNPTGKNRRTRQRRIIRDTGRSDPDAATPAELARAALERPKRRGDCAGGERPCPWVSCRYHLGLDVLDSGEISMAPGSDVTDLAATCALDIADQGGVTLEKVGEILGVTRERVRQIEYNALKKIRTVDPRSMWYDSKVTRAAERLVQALVDDREREAELARRCQVRALYRQEKTKRDQTMRGTP